MTDATSAGAHAAGPDDDLLDQDVAVLVPCRNEAATVTTVVADFRAALPRAHVHVFDNGSTDDTARLAREAGAHVHTVARPGKGNVVRKMFSDVDADVYLMVDGDATYDAGAAPLLIERLRRDGLDMVVGARVSDLEDEDRHRPGHRFGTRLFGWLYVHLFEIEFADVFSGYRAFTRRFVKSFPATTSGFDVETELIAHAAYLQVEVAEVPTRYRPRPAGEGSKLSTFGDGFHILRAALRLYRDTRPVRFFGSLALIITLVDLVVAAPIFETYLETGLVPRFPTAFLLAAMQVIAVVLLAVGLMGDSLGRLRREQRRLAFLAVTPRAGGRRLGEG